MSSILDLLQGPIGQQIISGVASQTGESTDKTSGLLSMAMPMLLGAMKKNASSAEGAQGLLGALSNHQGGVIDNLTGFFDGGVDESAQNDGSGILGHLLGSKQDTMVNALSQESGVNAGSVGNILKVAAPLLMGLVGKQTQSAGISDANGLTSLLGGLMGGSSSGGSSSLLTSILDADGDGSIIDDIAGMATGSKKGGIGGLLGGLFGK